MIYYFYALSRSGHHAIIQWINDCLSNRNVLHLNNCTTENNSLTYRQYSFLKEKESIFPNMEEGLFFKQHKISDVFASMENTIDFNEQCLENYISLFLENKTITKITIVRDFYNLFSSLIKFNSFELDFILKLKNLWKIQFNTKNYIINYNNWFLDENYKKNIFNDLKLCNFIKNNNYISQYGGGSSFDSFNYQNDADKMQVIKRWEFYKNNSILWDMIDDEIEELNLTHFGFYINKNTKELLNARI